MRIEMGEGEGRGTDIAPSKFIDFNRRGIFGEIFPAGGAIRKFTTEKMHRRVHGKC